MITKRWYFTDLPFDDHPSLQGSNHWNDITERGVLVGEQWFDPPWPERPRTVDGLDGDHECGELDDFEQGQPWPYDGPPIQYDDDHIPLCCPRVRPPQVRGGGSASAFFNVLPPPFASTCCDAPLMDSGTLYAATIHGGPIEGTQVFRYVATADAASLSINGFGNNFVATLQVTSGVDCAHQDTVLWAAFFGTYTIPLSTSVGRTVCINIIPNTLLPGGPYTLLVTLPGLPQVTGGGVPSATHSYLPPHGFLDPTDGGGEGGGAAGDVPNFIDATDGGGEGGGAAGDLLTFLDATDGGGEGGGAAGDVPSYTDAPAGGGEGGGAAGDVFLGAVPAVRDSTSGHTGSGVYTLPTRVSGDLLVAFIAVSSGTPTAGSGWTNGGIFTEPTSGLGFAIFRRISNGTDSAPTSAFTASYAIFAIQNATTVDTTNRVLGSTAATTLTTTSISPSRVSGTLVAWATAAAITSPSYPAGYLMTTELATLPDIAAGFKVAHTGVPVAPSMTVGTAVNYIGINFLFH